MKKTILTISIFATTALWAMADVVPSSKALQVAKEFMRASSLTLVWDGNEAQTRAGEDPAFYVFNASGGGWVIVSADDCTTPILGYSDKGTFRTEAMPENLSAWLGNIRTDIRQARHDGQKSNAEVRKRWSSPARRITRADATQKVLETASWDQESPYNNLLKTYVKNGNTGVSGLYTGCVATAMAEILRYHKWPEHGSGTLASYKTKSSEYSVTGYSIENHTYNWDNMPLTYSSSATTAQKNAVAQLMLDCGVMVEMDYGTASAGGSGAFSEDIVPALIEHMGYSKAAVHRYRSGFSLPEWLEMIQYEIDNNGPVLYSGSGDDGGHQFVCDGYDVTENMIHINWGWSGSSNGFFTLSLAIPRSYTFDEGQSAIFGLVPDKDGSSAYGEYELEMFAADFDDYPNAINGIELVSGTVAKGGNFKLAVGKFSNSGSQDYPGAIKAVLVDKNGRWKQDVSEPLEMVEDPSDPEDVGLPAGYLCWFEDDECLECSISEDIALGDRIAIWYRLRDGSWAPVRIDREDLSCPWEWACIDVTFIETKASYSAGEYYYFTLIPGNKGISSVSWSFDGTATTALGVKLTSGTHTVDAAITFNDNSSETISQTIVVK